jgi:hypothetical protein
MLGVLICWWPRMMAPYRGTLAVALAGPPRREAQPFANMVFALTDGVSGVAIDDKTVPTAGNQSNTERAVALGMARAGTENAVTSRYVSAERASSRTHIECVHVEFLQKTCLVICSGQVCHWPK